MWEEHTILCEERRKIINNNKNNQNLTYFVFFLFILLMADLNSLAIIETGIFSGNLVTAKTHC